MKIGLCYDTREAHGYKSINVYCCSLPSQKTVDTISALIIRSGFDLCHLGLSKEVIKSFSDTKFDLAFPMICSSNGRGKQIWLPATLELYNIPFVGSDARSVLLSSDKYQSGLLANTYGIPTIPSVVLIDSYGAEQAFHRSLTFPGVVKPNFESDSKGVYLVNNESEMWFRAHENWSTYKEKIIFQPYMSGTEITVSLYECNGEPVVFGMTETTDNDGIPLKMYSYEYKHLYGCKKRCPDISASLYEVICKYAKTLFKVFECHDYARVDFRLDTYGIPRLLEVTLAPSLPLSASFFMGGILYGVSPDVVIQHIIFSAMQRYGLSLKI